MNILITGSSRGIGAGLAEAYRTAGHTVFATARGSAEMPLDVTDPASHAALADRLGDAPLDLLICNAGVYLDRGHSLADGYPVEAWADTFAANVTGVFLTVQNCLPRLKRGTDPKIAILSSQMGSSTRNTGGSYIYRASKAAAVNLGRNLATDLAPERIAVGIYHPGWVQTDMGTAAAEITVEAAVAGLMARFEALAVAHTGVFQTWDGRDHPL